jgi:ribosome biogenesis protein MAK21
MESKPGLKTLLMPPEDDEEEHFEDIEEDGAPKKEDNKPNKVEYDGRKRDPRFSNAEKSCLWELVRRATSLLG